MWKPSRISLRSYSPAAAHELATDILERTGRLLSASPMIGRVGRIAGTRELVVSGTRYIVVYRLEDQVEVLEHFPTKWIPVRRRKCGKIKDLESFAIATRS